MKKKILMSLALSLSFGLAVSGCNAVTENDKNQTESTAKNQVVEENSKETEEASEYDEEFTPETETVDKQSVEGQLALISENFADCILDNSYFGITTHFTVADLNRNGRLELIIHDCQGTALNSYTCVYEVNEDFDSLELMPLGDNSAEHTQKWLFGEVNDVDTIGDIMLLDSLDCYEKDGVYYYILKDSTSGGYDHKESDFYFYRFDGEFECAAYIGGFDFRILPNEEGSSASYINLFGSDHELLSSDAEYEKNIEDVLSEYNYVSSCVLKWDFIPEEEEIEEKVKAAYEGYNPDADMDTIDFSSRVWLGDGEEYAIVLDEFNS